MKKLNLLMLLCIAVATSTYAQITVDSVGKVVIGDTAIVQKTTTRPRPQVGLGNKVAIFANGDFYNALTVHSKSLAQWGPAIRATADYVYDRQVAIMAYASTPKPQTSGRSYGIIASAGNCTSGYNYGVVGNLTGTNNGAAVMGVHLAGIFQ